MLTLEVATIERCAQVVDDYAVSEALEPMFQGVAAAIRRLEAGEEETVAK